MTKMLLGLLTLTLALAGCAPTPAQVVSRQVSAVATGGPGEVWVVMGETGAHVEGERAYVNRDVYALYHCLPRGCRRVGELQGSEVFER